MNDARDPKAPEITPAMVEAGIALLFDYDPAFSNERDIVAEIYRAMTRASLQAYPEVRPVPHY